MRKLSLLIALLGVICFAQNSSAQKVLKLNEDSIIFNITEDVQADLRDLWPQPNNIKWSRQVYREVFFSDSLGVIRSNSHLKYPDEPVTSYVVEGGIRKLVCKQNLFWLIFKLATTHKIPTYQSNDYQTFTENDLIKSDETLLANLKYEKSANGKLVVEDKYTRSLNTKILGYMLKENYYFDAEVSELRSQVIAIAPLIESGTMGGDRDYTIPFWVTYESIVPWLMNYTMMVSENNTADVISFDTYFRKRMFKGNIVKIENPLNYTLAKECQECCPQDIQACIKRKQGELEKQIINFDEKQLWHRPTLPPTKKTKASKDKGAKTTTSKKK